MSLYAFGIAFFVVMVAAFFGVMAGVVFHRIIGWYIEGAMGAVECVAAAGLFLVMAVWIVIAPSIFAKIALVVLLVVLVAALQFLGPQLERRETRKFYDERIEQYRQVIASDRLNLAARIHLVNALEKEGRLDEAIDELTELVRLAPKSRAEAHQLHQLIQKREECRDPPVACPSCGHRNPRSRTYCVNCEAELRAISEVREWLAGGGWSQIVRSSAVGVGILMGVLALGMLLPGPLRLLVVLAGLFVLVTSILVMMYMRR